MNVSKRGNIVNRRARVLFSGDINDEADGGTRLRARTLLEVIIQSCACYFSGKKIVEREGEFFMLKVVC